MNPKIKVIIINSMVGVSIMLLVISLSVGRGMESSVKEKRAAKNQEETFSFSGRSVSTDRIKEVPDRKVSADLQQIKPNKDLMEVIADGTEGKKVQIKKYSSYFPQEDLEASEKVAKQFVKAYYEFDGENPSSHVNRAKRFMTDVLYSQLADEIPRPTISTFRKEAHQVKVYEPFNVSGKQLVWMARVTGTVHGEDGKKTKDEVMEFRLTMVNETDFKVDDVAITLSN